MLNFILPDGKKVRLDSNKVKEIVTTELSPNFYWMHSGVLTKDEVMTFLERRADEKLLKKVCWYILFHAENLVFSVYLLTLANSGKKGAEKYLEFNKPLLEELRRLNREAGSYEVADRMIELCLKYGIDPF